MPLSVIGTFSYTNTTTALNQAPGNIIPSAGWNQIHGVRFIFLQYHLP